MDFFITTKHEAFIVFLPLMYPIYLIGIAIFGMFNGTIYTREHKDKVGVLVVDETFARNRIITGFICLIVMLANIKLYKRYSFWGDKSADICFYLFINFFFIFATKKMDDKKIGLFIGTLMLVGLVIFQFYVNMPF